MSYEAEFVFKIVAVGSGGVGKTSLIRRFALNKFGTNYVMTLGVDFTTKELTVFDKFVKIVCVDTAGQEYYGKIRPSYYSGATAAFIVFDITNRNSFESLPKWIAELRQYLPNIPIAIVGFNYFENTKLIVSPLLLMCLLSGMICFRVLNKGK